MLTCKPSTGWIIFLLCCFQVVRSGNLQASVATCDFWPMKRTNWEVKPTNPKSSRRIPPEVNGVSWVYLGVQSYLQTPGVWKPREIDSAKFISPYQKFANLNKRHGDDMKGEQNYMPAELLFPTTTNGIAQQNMTQTTTRRNFYSFVPCSRWEHVW